MPGTLCSGLSHTRDLDTWAVGWVLPPGLGLQLHTELLALPGLHGPGFKPFQEGAAQTLVLHPSWTKQGLDGDTLCPRSQGGDHTSGQRATCPYNTVHFLPGHWDSCSPQPSTRAPKTTQLGAWSSWHDHVTQGCNF